MRYRSNLSRLELVPGEEFSVPLDDDNLMMKPRFTAKEVDLKSRRNKDMIRFQQKLDTENVEYKSLDIPELEGVFKSLGFVDKEIANLQSRLITLVGDPGTGKTTAAQRFAWKWAKGTGCLPAMYKLVFFVPVRHLRRGSLMEELSHLTLLPGQFTGGFEGLSAHSKDILFILDGADEGEITSEMHNLITGEIFAESTVLITARQEAKCFNFSSVIPKVKITLLGTDGETVHRYMKEVVSPSSEEEWNLFEENYKEKIQDISLLHVPLYLMLVCTIFKAHIAKGLKLRVPESATELFNGFLHVILMRWMARSSSNKESHISFNKSPLGPDSTLPAHMKRCLYFIGKLCYMDLTQPTSTYEFRDSQANECLLDMQDIKDSGLFTVGNAGSHEVFLLKHKQFQEYLAALYLSFEGTKTPLFHDLLYDERNKGQCLAVVMRNSKLIKIVEFACGLSAQFLKSLLGGTASQFCVMKNGDGQIDIYYEAALFTEQHPGDLSSISEKNLEGFSELQHYLCTSEQTTVDYEDFNFLLADMHYAEKLGFYQKCLQKLIPLFDTHLSLQLLSKCYNIILTPGTIKHSTIDQLCKRSVTSDPVMSPVSLVSLHLDQLETELLGAVCIPGVQEVDLSVGTAYVDLPGLLSTFPHLTQLDVTGLEFIPYQSLPESDRKISTTLTHVSLRGQHTHLPQAHIQCLLKQDGLTHLTLLNVCILPALSYTQVHPSLWSHLKYLKLWDDCSEHPSLAGSAICRLLISSCDTLEECSLKIQGVAEDLVWEIADGLKSLVRLQGLRLQVMLCDDSDVTGGLLISVLPHLTSLNSLDVENDSVQQCLTALMDSLCTHSHMRLFAVRGGYDKFPLELKHKLESKGIEVAFRY